MQNPGRTDGTLIGRFNNAGRRLHTPGHVKCVGKDWGNFPPCAIQLAQTSDQDKWRHLSLALQYGIHSVFHPPAISGHNGEEPISVKKLKEGEGLWEVRKEIL